MKISVLLATAVSLAAGAAAQVFNSGSSGALGDVLVTSNTVWDIPNNGQFHVNTLVVEAGVTLSFRKPTSGLNPPVYILARSNVTIHGAISVDGQHGGQGMAFSEGGPGGFNGGGAGFPPTIKAGDGQGPGRGIWNGRRGGGSYGTAATDTSLPGSAGPTYGNLLLFPLIGGSGGAGGEGNPSVSGGGGGGAILIASDTQVELSSDGRIYARGGDGGGSINDMNGCGSGGGVRLVAPTIAGNGQIQVGGGFKSGDGEFIGPFYGGNGRARIDCRPQPVTITVVGRRESVPWRVGRNPAIFSLGLRLDIIHAAGRDIPPGTNSSVLVTLPLGSSSNQVVTLRAVNYTGEFDVTVEATPENGQSSRQSFRFNAISGNATTNVTVTIPGNIPTRITAWAEVLF